VTKSYTVPTNIGDDAAANLAFFLLENTGSIWGYWYGPMRAADQRKLFGRFIGKGWVCIHGEDETVKHSTSVCFGTMREYQSTHHWRDLSLGASK
jgi:hypothetical protein